MKSSPLALLPCLAACLLAACETAPPPEVLQRRAVIAREPPGDYFIGRRYFVPGTRFWGWIRRPGEPWDTARLVVMNESRQRTPDRLPEDPAQGPPHGYDNNFEYRLEGRITGAPVYDPNSNLVLPEFLLTGIDLRERRPGFLFRPDEEYRTDAITIYPRSGIPQL